MKKYVLYCTVSVLLFNACTYQNAQGLKKESYAFENGAASVEKRVQDPSLELVDQDKARRMVKHYKDNDTKKDKGGYLQFDPKELLQLVEQPYVTDVKLVHAAYLASEADINKRNMATILICVTESAGATTYKYYTSSKICPPPDGGCSVEN